MAKELIISVTKEEWALLCGSELVKKAYNTGIIQTFFYEGDFLIVPSQAPNKLLEFIRSHENLDNVRPAERRFYTAIRAIYNDLLKGDL